MSETDWESKYKSLVRLLNNDRGQGIYPQGHLSEEDRQRLKKDGGDAYKKGWNDAVMERSRRLCDIMAHAENGLSDDLAMLLASDQCSASDNGSVTLNMNDTWGWAESWCPVVPKEEIADVARLFKSYGRAGLMYWHSCKENNMKSEFHDNNRAIEFVRNEERIRAETPDYNERAYRKVQYTIGAEWGD